MNVRTPMLVSRCIFKNCTMTRNVHVGIASETVVNYKESSGRAAIVDFGSNGSLIVCKAKTTW